MNQAVTCNFIKKLPKAELHVHIEGTLEPEQMLLFAERNGVKLPYTNADQIKKSREFSNIQQFLEMCPASVVLEKEQDFYELMAAYLEKAVDQQVVHAEIFFELQSYLLRGVNPHTVINGLISGMLAMKKKLDISSSLILCFLRDASEKDAFKVFEYALNYKDTIIGVGLASDALGNPPEKFRHVFAHARSHGFHAVAHAGEQDGPDAIWQALSLLQAERIDHGVRSIEDNNLVQTLIEKKIPLTVCPLSNKALGFFKTIKSNPLIELFNRGVITTINSDDPAYFGGYIAENYRAVAQAFNLSKHDLVALAQNSFQASFLDNSIKELYIKQLTSYLQASELARE